MTEPNKGGRPSVYTPEIAEAICQRIAEGESLRAICEDAEMPDRGTVMRWLARKEHEEFRHQYARARELQADVLFDDCLKIADDASGDYIEKEVGDEGATVQVVDHEHISRSKLRVDTRKWIAGKLAPKKYGERVALTGPEGGPIETADKTPKASRQQVLDDLVEIFGGVVPQPPAPKSAGKDRVVRKGAGRGRRKKPGAPAAG